MDQLIEKGSIVLQGLGGLVIVATAVVKLTPSPKDDKNISKISKALMDFLKFLPTIGVNPRTKKLEEQLKEMQKDVSNP